MRGRNSLGGRDTIVRSGVCVYGIVVGGNWDPGGGRRSSKETKGRVTMK